MTFLSKNNVNDINAWLEEVSAHGAAVLIDKSKDWTSFDVVAKLRSLIKVKKVGHAGTLDPLATGLLIVLAGKATKKQSEFQGMSKKYLAKIKLGATTKTDDSEADEENIKEIGNLGEKEILEVINSFLGEIEQIPPMYSAKKVKGQRLYKLARKNETCELEPSLVAIHSINNITINLPYLEFEVDCSKGTYIRALARDIGNKLECGGYLSELRRTSIHDFNVQDALTISEFESLLKRNSGNDL